MTFHKMKQSKFSLPVTVTDATSGIFTNNIFHENKSGLLINDITDHHLIFTLCPYDVERNPKKIFIYKRRNDEEFI